MPRCDLRTRARGVDCDCLNARRDLGLPDNVDIGDFGRGVCQWGEAEMIMRARVCGYVCNEIPVPIPVEEATAWWSDVFGADWLKHGEASAVSFHLLCVDIAEIGMVSHGFLIDDCSGVDGIATRIAKLYSDLQCKRLHISHLGL